MIEQGAPVEIGAWFGLLAPAGTPPAAIAWLNREANKVFATAEGSDRFVKQGAAVPLLSTDAFAQIHAGGIRPLRRGDPARRHQDRLITLLGRASQGAKSGHRLAPGPAKNHDADGQPCYRKAKQEGSTHDL